MRTRFPKPARIFRAVLAVCALTWLQAAPAHAAAGKTYVEIGEIGSTAQVRLRVGDTLRVTLRVNSPADSGWRIETNNRALLETGTVTNLPVEDRKSGASGRQRFSFTAKSPGQDRLVLAYISPEKQNPRGKKDAGLARRLVLSITITNAGAGGDPALAVRPEGVLFGKFTGKLPCADCSGIDETLLLYSPGPNDFVNAYYVDNMTYLGGRNGNLTNVSAGRWFVERGAASDPNATVYSLSLDASERDQNYLRKSDVLVPLDPQRKLIQSPFDMSLHRVP